MTQILQEQLSAFVDGELPTEELDLLLARVDREPGARALLARYAMVGECIRSGSANVAALAIGERVRTALSTEPAVSVSPVTSQSWRAWVAGGIAAAAALVAVLVSGPGSWRDTDVPAPGAVVTTLAGLDEPLTDIRPSVNRRLNPRAAARLTGYLVAHGQYTNQLSRNNFDSHLVSARAERASWRQPQDAGDVR